MQEKQRIQEQLHQLQVECVKQYLQNKLETITTKEVVSDILQGFIQFNNEEFMENIADNILQAKINQKNLRQELQNLKINHQLQLHEFKAQITQERDLFNQNKYNQMLLGLKQQINSLTYDVKQQQLQTESVKSQNRALKEKLQGLSQTNIALENSLKGIMEQKQKISLQHQSNCKTFEKLIVEKDQQCSDEVKLLTIERDDLKSRLVQLCEALQVARSSCGSQLELRRQRIQSLQTQLQDLKQANQAQEICLTSLNSKHNKLENELMKLLSQKGSVEEEKQSLELSHRYLQQENSYLREEIITFKSREQKLTQEKSKLKKDLDNLTTSSNQQIQKLSILKLNLQQELKQSLADLTQHYQAEVFTLKNHIGKLEAQLQKLKEQKQLLEQELNNKQTELFNQQEQNKCLHTQIHFHFEQNEVHEREIQRYQSQLLKVNQECRAQLETFKQTYDLNWNAVNEELIEQKFRGQQQRQEMDELRSQLQLQQDRQKFYNMYVQEISHLKRQLEIVTSNRKYIFNRSEVKFEDNKAKFYYYLSKIKQELQGLRQQNEELRNKLIRQASSYKKQFQESLSYLVVKVRQQYLKCSYCQHQKILADKPRQKQRFNPGFQKTMPKVALAETSSFSTLKKSLKSIQQRYQVVNQQNKFYTEHINSIIKNA